MKNKSNELLHALREDVTSTLTSLGLSLPNAVKPQELLQIVDDYVKDYSLPEVLEPELRTFLVSLLQKIFGVAYLRLDQAMGYYHKSESTFKQCPEGNIPLYGNGPNPVRHIDTDEVLEGELFMVSRCGYPGMPYYIQGKQAVQESFVFLPEFPDVNCKFTFLWMTFMSLHKKYYLKYISGTTVKTIRSGYIRELKVPILELPKQLEIVKRIYSVLEAKEVAEKSLADLKQLKAQYLKEAMKKVAVAHSKVLEHHLEELVTDLDSACKKLGFALPELTESQKSSLVTSLQEYAAGEDLSQFSELYKSKNISKTATKLSSKHAEQEHTLEVFTHLVQHLNGVVELPLALTGQKFSVTGIQKQNAEPGDIALWISAQEPMFVKSEVWHDGFAVIIPRKGHYAGTVYSWNGPKVSFDNASIEPRSFLHGEYLYYAAKAKQKLITSLAAGTGVPCIPPAKILSTKVLLPKLELQKEIADELAKLDESEVRLKQIAKECDTLFKSKVNETFSALDPMKAN